MSSTIPEYITIHRLSTKFKINSCFLTVRPIYTCNFCCDFQCDFLLLTDVKEWISNECSEYRFLPLNIRVWFTHSHPSKGENRTRNRSKSCKCERAFMNINDDWETLETKFCSLCVSPLPASFSRSYSTFSLCFGTTLISLSHAMRPGLKSAIFGWQND